MREVTFGQYYPAKSPIHRLDGRVKILSTIIYIVLIFFIQTYVSYIIATLFLLLAVAMSKIPFRKVLKSIKPMLFLVIFIFLLNLFLTKDGKVLGEWWIFRITDRGIDFALKMAIRLVLVVMGASILTLATTPTELTNAIESLLAPLKLIKIPVTDIAVIMSLAIRFIPTIVEETDKIMMAQKARGSGFDTGGFLTKIKAMLPILIPLFVSSFRRADELADALDARCYGVSKKRTKLKKSAIGLSDIIAMLTVCALLAFVLLDKYYFLGLDHIVLGFFGG